MEKLMVGFYVFVGILIVGFGGWQMTGGGSVNCERRDVEGADCVVCANRVGSGSTGVSCNFK